MGKILAGIPTTQNIGVGTGIQLLPANPNRHSVMFSMGQTSVQMLVWPDFTQLQIAGFIVNPNVEPLIINYERVGHLLYTNWFVRLIGGAGGSISFIETIETQDFGVTNYATRQQPEPSVDREFLWGFPRAKRRTNRNLDTVAPDDSLHNLILRRRRFRQ